MSGLAYKCGFCSYTVISKSKKEAIIKLAFHYMSNHFDQVVEYLENRPEKRKYVKRKISEILSKQRRKYRDIFDRITDTNSLKETLIEIMKIRESTDNIELRILLLKALLKAFTYVARLTMKEITKMSNTNKFTFIAKKQT